MNASIWSFEGRIRRVPYFWIVLATGLAGAIIPESVNSSEGAVVLLLLLIPLIWLSLAAATKRCDDVGKSGWWVLLSLVPFVNLVFGIYLLFAPGCPQANAYGQPPAGPDDAPAPAQTQFPAVARPQPAQPTGGVPHSPPGARVDEDLWAQALAEFESEAKRRPGLWARVYAEAGGDEHAAKAAYLSARHAELQEEGRTRPVADLPSA